jgi:hypothetical protein
MANNDLLDRIPGWVKSLWDMENELRNAARTGLFLRKDEAAAHLAEARRHLDDAWRSVQGAGPIAGPRPPEKGDDPQ